MSNVENLRDTIAPKSDQLNSDDLMSTTKIIKVTAVKRGSTAEQPVSIEYEGMTGNPFKPCKSMRRVLIAAWSENGHDWVGKSMNLFCDPEVKFGGVKIGGIRISHLSDIEGDKQILIATSRGKRSDYRVKKLSENYPQDEFNVNKLVWIDAIKAETLTLAKLIDKANRTRPFTTSQIETLKLEIESLKQDSAA